MTALVVDHQLMHRVELGWQLEACGITRVLEADHAEQVPDILRNEAVDLVVCDLSPETGGLLLLEVLRSDADWADLPVMLIAEVLERQSARAAIALGANELLIRPIALETLQQRMVRLLEAATLRREQAGGEQRADILIVDDSAVDRQVLASMLRHRFRVRVAGTADKALELIEQRRPDLVLLDVMLPDADGFDLAASLQQQHNPPVPIIFVSARVDDRARLKGLALGAIDYVFKPVEPEVLQLRVANLLRHLASS